MSRPTPEQVRDYWHRSYRTVDGLWFMKIEERYGFDTALEIDREVWRTMPKIQARMIQSMLQVTTGIDALYQSLKLKLELEGYVFRTEKTDNKGFKFIISDCPWHNTMVRSNRKHLSGKVGTLICTEENNLWISEFGGDMSFKFAEQICEGGDSCIMRFDAGGVE